MTRTPEPADIARAVMLAEASAIEAAADRLGHQELERAVDLVRGCGGSIYCSGAGTSGVIARKVAATLASTGTPCMFLNPSEAMHGGLGVLRHQDVLIAISNSGETGELLVMLPYLRHRDIRIIAIVGTVNSTLGGAADVILDAGVAVEAGPLGLAPTSSSAVALAVGDALSMVLLEAREFTSEQFALNHPSGQLGRRLTLKVEDVIFGEFSRPAVPASASVLDALTVIGSGGVGAVAVVGGDGDIVGLVTDGDVRRYVAAGSVDLEKCVAELMTESPTTVELGTLAYDALQEMEDRPSQISVLPVIDRESGTYVAMLRVHDLIRAGI